VRAIRPILLGLLLVGVLMTFASEPRVDDGFNPSLPQQTGYGDQGPTGIGSDTVPPRSLFLGDASDLDMANVIAAIAGVVVVGAGTTLAVKRRNGNGNGNGSDNGG
jgi:hypothetical protein